MTDAMRAMLLEQPGHRLRPARLPHPTPGPGLAEANQGLERLEAGLVRGAAVLVPIAQR